MANITLNESKIMHYQVRPFDLYELKGLIRLNEEYLREKPNWYIIDGELYYFKKRSDTRLFTELFVKILATEIFGIETLDYKVASLRIIDPTKSSKIIDNSIGLLSKSFQVPNKNYYLVSELFDPNVSDLRAYSSDYSLEGLLAFFENTLCQEDYKKCKDFLIKVFLLDAFTAQLDRNPNNIGFEIPKVEGLSYKKRLRPSELSNNPDLTVNENGIIKLKDGSPSLLFDSERIIGIDHKDVILEHYKEGSFIWTPLLSFNSELSKMPFSTYAENLKIVEGYDGMDPNLFNLIESYPNECKEIIRRITEEDEYKGILDSFKKNGLNDQVILLQKFREYCEAILSIRKNAFSRVRSYFE